jgi:hypothetical protein
MVIFWVWGVRNPCVALGALATAAGTTGVADWSISLATLMVLGMCAEAANHLGRRAKARRDRHQAVITALASASAARGTFRKAA